MARVPRFLPTDWSLIRKASSGDRHAFDTIVRRYRRPVREFLQLRGFSPEDAEDLTQEVFLQAWKSNVLANIRKGNGRFRSYILALTKHAASHARRRNATKKRGGDMRTIPFGPELQGMPSDNPEDDFDRLWFTNILLLSMSRMSAVEGEKAYLQALRLFLGGVENYREIAFQLSKSEQNVKNYMHTARQKLAHYIREELAFQCRSNQDLQDEYNRLIAWFPKLSGERAK